MKNIKTFDDVLAAKGITKEQFIEKTKGDTPDEVGYKKIKMIAEVLNGDDPGECIYYPWFWKKEDSTKPSGSGLSFDGTGFGHSITDVASRLKYRTSKIAQYAGETFILEYEEYLLS